VGVLFLFRDIFNGLRTASLYLIGAAFRTALRAKNHCVFAPCIILAANDAAPPIERGTHRSSSHRCGFRREEL